MLPTFGVRTKSNQLGPGLQLQLWMGLLVCRGHPLFRENEMKPKLLSFRDCFLATWNSPNIKLFLLGCGNIVPQISLIGFLDAY